MPLIFLALMACQSGMETSVAFPTNVPTSIPTVYPTVQPIASQYEQYTIEYLRGRTYGGGQIEILELLAETEAFTRYLIRYPSDGLTVYGFANVPKGAGPYPIIIAIHGFVASDTYLGPDFDTDAFDRITQNGYIVIHPYLRNYAPSDNGNNAFRVGMSVDVLNLIALVKSNHEPAEIFSNAAQDQIGLWGYSLGGGIALRVLTISADVKAAVLYASISGDENKNLELFSQLSSEPNYESELLASPDELQKISPVNFYHYITAPIQLYHGTADSVVPVAWAEETCAALQNANVTVNCRYFTDEEHSFRRRVSDEFYGTMFDFYNKHLSP